MERRPRILFFVESVTMAHLTRVVELASGLGSAYEVFVASYELPEYLKPQFSQFKMIKLRHGLNSAEFSAKIAKGEMPYSRSLLEKYIDEETQIITELQPEVVVGDFRITLAISRQMIWFKYINITNAVWSPRNTQGLTVPELPVHQWISPKISQMAFQLFKPIILRQWHKAFNQVARRRKVSPFKTFLELYCSGDEVLYLDIPDFFPGLKLTSHEHFIGPSLFSLDAPMPVLPRSSERPLVYVSLGSSGNSRLLPMIAKVLSQMQVDVIISTSNQDSTLPKYKNISVHNFLPAREVLKRSSLMIANGGAPSLYLALSEKVPVLAIASNMDQHLNSRALARCGAGIYLRSDRIRPNKLEQALLKLLGPEYGTKAQQCSEAIQQWNSKKEFKKFIDSQIPSSQVFQKELG